MDIGFVGAQSTWCNNHQGGAKVWNRIDRFFASVDWIQMHSRYQVLHLLRIISDHQSVLILFKVYSSHQAHFGLKSFILGTLIHGISSMRSEGSQFEVVPNIGRLGDLSY